MRAPVTELRHLIESTAEAVLREELRCASNHFPCNDLSMTAEKIAIAIDREIEQRRIRVELPQRDTAGRAA